MKMVLQPTGWQRNFIRIEYLSTLKRSDEDGFRSL